MKKLKNAHYTDDIKWPTSLISIKELSEKTGVTTSRLQEMVDCHYIPHWKLDGGTPMFQVSETKKWIAANMLTRVEGTDLPINLKVCVEPPKASIIDAPVSIREIENLRMMPHYNMTPAVYFLVEKDKVVYIGQSTNPASRVAAHDNIKVFDRVFILPVPRSALNGVEGALIRLLQPKLNGGERNQKNKGLQAPGDPADDEDYLAVFVRGKEGGKDI
jgi:hypothetical protein